MHGRGFAGAGEILLDRGDKISRLLAAQAGHAGGHAIAILAVTFRTGLGQLLSVVIGREDFRARFLSGGGGRELA